MTKDELLTKNAELEAQVAHLQNEVQSLRSQITHMNERHEVAAYMLGDAIINNRVLAEQQYAPTPHQHGTLSAREAQELGMA